MNEVIFHIEPRVFTAMCNNSFTFNIFAYDAYQCVREMWSKMHVTNENLSSITNICMWIYIRNIHSQVYTQTLIISIVIYETSIKKI